MVGFDIKKAFSNSPDSMILWLVMFLAVGLSFSLSWMAEQILLSKPELFQELVDVLKLLLY